MSTEPVGLTRRRNRGTLQEKKGLRPKVACRFCPAKFVTFDELRDHARTNHTKTFYQVNRCLAKVDAKLRSLENLAKEGMVGYKVGATYTFGVSRPGWLNQTHLILTGYNKHIDDEYPHVGIEIADDATE